MGRHPATLSSVVLEPEHSLLEQSYAPKEMLSGVVNADGFGVGWYARDLDPDPAVYRSEAPIWGDSSLASMAPRISSHAIFAAVRSATPGLPVEKTGSPPFSSGRLMFMHNGAIPDFRRTAMRPLRDSLSDASYSGLLGATDSETIFACLRDRIGGGDERELAGAVRDTIRFIEDICSKTGTTASLNIGLTDGEAMVFSRYSPAGKANSMYYSLEKFPEAVIVASERLDDGEDWDIVPEGTLLISDGSSMEIRPL